MNRDPKRSIVYPLPERPEFCLIVPGFLSRAECRRHIASSEARGFRSSASDYPRSYRNNDRQVVDDAALADQLLTRLRPYAPATVVEAGTATAQRRWELGAINSRFRFCRYGPGQRFGIHQDGVHHAGIGRQSRLTFMIYLDDGDDFEGGDTLFYDRGPSAETAAGPIARVRPRAGSLILFDHELWHAGAEVTAGTKHILRSDVIYRCGDVPAQASGAFSPAHDGYVWTLERTAGGVASAGRDCTIRLWSEDGCLQGMLRGHTQSVLGLATAGQGRLASVSRDRTLRWWDIDARTCERVVVAHDAAALAVTVLADGDIASGGADGAIRCWGRDGRLQQNLVSSDWVWDIAEVGGDELACASERGDIEVWSRRSAQVVFRMPGDSPLRALAVAADGTWLASGAIDGHIGIWRRSDGGWMLQRKWRAHSAAVRRVRRLGSDTLVSAGEDGCVRIWNLVDGSLHHAYRHESFATDALALNEHDIVSCSYDGTILRHAACMPR